AMTGVLRAGLILSNINPLYTPAETRRQLDDCNAKALIFIDLFGDKIDTLAEGGLNIHLIKLRLTDFFSPLKALALDAALKYARRLVPTMHTHHVRFIDAIKMADRHDSGEISYTEEQDANAPNFYQYSGGTTGKSKGVELTFSGLMHNIDQVGSLAPDLMEKERQTVLLVMPLYHMFGFYMAMSGLKLGGHIILIPSPRPLKNLKPAFEKFPPHVFPGVNTLFTGLLKEDWFLANPPPLEFTATGATALNSSVAKQWRAVTGADILESYGMTEATTVLTSNPPGDRMREGSVGLPIPGVSIRILKDDDSWATTGEAGEIVARGPQLMKRYFNAPEESEKAFFDGWLRTGDIGYLDKDGYLFLVDRKKDMIIISGFNVFPNEIEDALTQYEGVSEAGVVGIDDGETGEKIIAFIVPQSTEIPKSDLDAHCNRLLTNYKRPRQYIFVDELPKTPVGKILRRELRDRVLP
ncbi:MAG: AMP-binding protein, partial [Pseudomonadota bacterium]